jgi:hypothetical protein
MAQTEPYWVELKSTTNPSDWMELATCRRKMMNKQRREALRL